VCVGPVLAHAVQRSTDSRLAADMAMWIGPADYRGGPLSVPCTYLDAAKVTYNLLIASTSLSGQGAQV